MIAHLLVTLAKLGTRGGLGAVAAESLAVKHQLLIMKRAQRRAPNLTSWDRLVLGACALLVSPKRVSKMAVILKPSTLLCFHHALVKRKYRLLYSPRKRGRPGPKGPSKELIGVVIEMKRRNPRFGCRKIAEQISRAFAVEINKDIVRRILIQHYRPVPGGDRPSWLTVIGNAKDSLWSVDLFRSESILLKSYWVMVVMDTAAVSSSQSLHCFAFIGGSRIFVYLKLMRSKPFPVPLVPMLSLSDLSGRCGASTSIEPYFGTKAILSGSSRITRSITTNIGVTAGWPELHRLRGVAYLRRQSQNLTHIPGGSIATAYFRPQLPPELEFDTDRLAVIGDSTSKPSAAGVQTRASPASDVLCHCPLTATPGQKQRRQVRPPMARLKRIDADRGCGGLRTSERAHHFDRIRANSRPATTEWLLLEA